MRAQEIEPTSVSAPEQTTTTQRWKIALRIDRHRGELPTKIEFSRRNLDAGTEAAPVEAELIRRYRLYSVIVQHYGTNAAFSQKVSVLAHCADTQARDIFDLDLLIAAGGTVAGMPDTLRKRLPVVIDHAIREYAGLVRSTRPIDHAPDIHPALTRGDSTKGTGIGGLCGASRGRCSRTPFAISRSRGWCPGTFASIPVHLRSVDSGRSQQGRLHTRGAPDMTARYFEDMQVGLVFEGERYVVERDEMLEFARKWDPRPIHLDEQAGRDAGFGGVIASGAYSTAIFTRLALAARESDGGHAVIAGLGATMALPKPVRAGDVLEFRAEIIEARPSRSRLDAGVVSMRSTLANQRGEIVYETTTATLVARRRP